MMTELVKDPRIPDHQGFVAISPSDPNPKGLLFFTEAAALGHKANMDVRLEEYPKGFNTDHWKERPEPWQVFKLTISERIA
jgi:hypothetical protein